MVVEHVGFAFVLVSRVHFAESLPKRRFIKTSDIDQAQSSSSVPSIPEDLLLTLTIKCQGGGSEKNSLWIWDQLPETTTYYQIGKPATPAINQVRTLSSVQQYVDRSCLDNRRTFPGSSNVAWPRMRSASECVISNFYLQRTSIDCEIQQI